MKRLFILLFVCIATLVSAQEPDLERAKRYFDRTHYAEATILYEVIVENDKSVEVLKNLADCYYYTNNLKSAEKYYSFLIKKYEKDLDEDYYFKYSQCLKASKKHQEAYQLLKDYYNKTNNIDKLKTLTNGFKELENVTAIGDRYKIENLAINTKNSEFGAVEKEDQLVFATAFSEPRILEKTYKWNNEGYLNLASIPLKNINSKDSIVNYFAKELKSSVHESNAVFTKDGKTMYFTRNNSKNGRRKKNQEKVSNIKIFKAEKVNGIWSKVVPLPFNSDSYSTEHPALSSDEQTLYFASDMPGGMGSFDIYSVDINGDNFGTPKNLGEIINTSKKEQFPFVSKDHKLYFSSNGHEGYGSLDVFVSEIKLQTYTKPLNIGKPINSNLDDFAFNINSDTKKGYFSSNRYEGKGGDDIYTLTELKDLVIEDCKQYITGVITDEDTRLPIDNVTVVLQDINGKYIDSKNTSSDGKFSFTVACEQSFKIEASKYEYTKNSRQFTIGKERGKTHDGSMTLKSLVAIQKEKEQAELKIKEAEEKAKLVAETKKKEEEEKVKKIVEQQKKDKVNKIIAEEKDVIKLKDKIVIKTDPIYFDYDLWYIRRDSKQVLNRVVELMNKYPDMMVEIGAHTDSRGSVKYNDILSQKRATSTMEYIIESGIPKERISAKGYGKSQPIIKCATKKACTEEQHELNRRSEFVIINFNAD